MTNYIFDFDSTLVKSETLNEVLSLALGDDEVKKAEVDRIMNLAMDGKITPRDSMESRLKLATIDKNTIAKITEETKDKIMEGVVDLIRKLKSQPGTNIYIVSGGFREMIEPIAEILGIPAENIYANEFIYEGDIVKGVKDLPTIQNHGKVKQIEKMKNDGVLSGKTVMIGDGYTDFETELFGVVDNFICFTGVVDRESVRVKAKNIAKNVDELHEMCVLFDK